MTNLKPKQRQAKRTPKGIPAKRKRMPDIKGFKPRFLIVTNGISSKITGIVMADLRGKNDFVKSFNTLLKQGNYSPKVVYLDNGKEFKEKLSKCKEF